MGTTMWLRTTVILMLAAVTLAGCQTSLRSVRDIAVDTRLARIEAYLEKDDPRGLEWFRKFPLRDDRKLENWFIPRAHRMPPMYLFIFASRQQAMSKFEKAFYWLIAGQGRYLYDLHRCLDFTVEDRFNVKILPQFKPTVLAMLKTPNLGRQVIRDATTWDRVMPVHYQLPVDECKSGLEGIHAGLKTIRGKLDGKLKQVDAPNVLGGKAFVAPMAPGGAEQWLKPAAEFPEIRRTILARMAKTIDSFGR